MAKQANSNNEKSPQAKKAAVKATGATREDRRAALRAQQLKQQQAARRRKQIQVGALILALAVLAGAILAAVLWYNSRPKSDGTPQHLNADKNAITLYADKAKQGAKTVTVYSDFQCPGCKSFDQNYGKSLVDMAKNGDIKLEFRTLTFLDQNLKNDASTRAAVAAACVDATSDKYFDYFTTIYDNQPQKEGVGYTDDQLKSTFAQKAGLAGDELKKFQACYDQKASKSFVTSTDTAGEKSLSQLYPNGAFSTPSITVNGKLMDMQQLKGNDPNALKAAIDATK